MSTGPSWELYEAFLAAARTGSLSAAARSLRLAQPTVRRRIDALEAALGARLFTRSPNGLLPTEAARRIQPFAETMEATSRSLVRALDAGGDQLTGAVRIAASELTGAELLPPLLAPLRRRHPGLAIELAISDRVADLSRRDADVAIRMTPPRGASLVARRLEGLALGLFASGDYLARRGAPGSLEALRDHDLIGLDADPQLIEGLAAAGLALERRDFGVRTDAPLAILGAIQAGLGIGVTYVPIGARRGLRRVLPALALPLEIWLVTHRDLRQVPRIRAVMDHLAAAWAEGLGR